MDILVGGGFTHLIIFTPVPAEMIQFDEHIFTDGLVQPPTSLNEKNGGKQP